MKFRVAKVPSASLALTNCVYINQNDFAAFTNGQNVPFVHLKIKGFVFNACPHSKIEQGCIAFSAVQRNMAMISEQDAIEPVPYRVEEVKDIYLANLELEVNFFKKSNLAAEEVIDCEQLEAKVKENFNLQVFTLDQKLVLEMYGQTLALRVLSYDVVDLDTLKSGDVPSTKTNAPYGLFTKKAQVSFQKAGGAPLRLKGTGSAGQKRNLIFRPDWNFESMGIGGLDAEFSDIFRRAFASRVFPTSVVKQLGVAHVKGMLLYGPPGTGKTLLARQIGKMLNGREPKIVKGPEVLSKFVGESEENIRKLFADAEKEYAERGDDSDLHIIIFDEIDAICKQRGSVNSGTGVHDTVVNQLLAKIDGVDSLNNILVIGMTNRKDMIDDALLRAGRLEVHVEIGLPDEHGRQQIFRIHTQKMLSSGHLAPDVDILELAMLTKNYTGAEIEGVVKGACSYAFDRCIDAHDPTHPQNPESIMINRDDFMSALKEYPPKFGVNEDEFGRFAEYGIISYGAKHEKLVESTKLFIDQLRTSSRTPLISLCLEGFVGTGKTALAVSLAVQSGFPFVKIISPETYVGYSEASKIQMIAKVFDDAYRSPLSCVVVDDIERLLEFVAIGPRFSNAVLQTLMVLFRKAPPTKGRKLLVIATTSKRQLLNEMGLMECFHAILSMPMVTAGSEVEKVLASLEQFKPEEIKAILPNVIQPLPIKKLLMVAEMSLQVKKDRAQRFLTCLSDYGVDDYL